MKYKTIFLDLDDTLVDTYKNAHEAIDDIYLEYAIDKYIPNKQDFIKKYELINNHLWELYEDGKIDKEELKRERFTQTLKDDMDLDKKLGLEINNRFMMLVSSKSNVIEEAIDILEYLEPKYQLNILSNGFTEVQEKKMNGAKINQYFDHIILSDHIGKNKPHPDLFAHALKIANADQDRTIMIGDNIKTDILGAKNSGIDQIWFNPKNSEDTNRISPTYTIAKLSELKNIL